MGCQLRIVRVQAEHFPFGMIDRVVGDIEKVVRLVPEYVDGNEVTISGSTRCM